MSRTANDQPADEVTAFDDERRTPADASADSQEHGPVDTSVDIPVDTLADQPPGASELPLPAGQESAATSLLPPAETTLQRYFHEIKQFALLTGEEEHELAVRYRERGDLEAAYRLITANLRLVVKIAMEYRQAQVQLLDLIQEGNIGLQEAVMRFDPYRGVKLSTYAAWWIKAFILKFLLDNWSQVRIGTTRAQKKLFFRLNREKRLLEQQGYTVGPKLLAERLNVKEEEVVEMEQRLGSWGVSLDEPVQRDSTLVVADRLAADQAGPEEDLAKGEFNSQVHEKILEFRETLKDNERLILDRRHLAEQTVTLQALGDSLGVTRERARQIEARLLTKLKAYLLEAMPDVEDHVD